MKNLNTNIIAKHEWVKRLLYSTIASMQESDGSAEDAALAIIGTCDDLTEPSRVYDAMLNYNRDGLESMNGDLAAFHEQQHVAEAELHRQLHNLEQFMRGNVQFLLPGKAVALLKVVEELRNMYKDGCVPVRVSLLAVKQDALVASASALHYEDINEQLETYPCNCDTCVLTRYVLDAMKRLVAMGTESDDAGEVVTALEALIDERDGSYKSRIN